MAERVGFEPLKPANCPTSTTYRQRLPQLAIRLVHLLVQARIGGLQRSGFELSTTYGLQQLRLLNVPRSYPNQTEQCSLSFTASSQSC